MMPSHAKSYKLVVEEPDRHQRVDKFLHQHLPQFSRSYLQKLIEKEQVTVSGRVVKASHRLETGEIVELVVPPPEETHLKPQPIPITIVYEDEHLVVVDKPAGMVVHPGAGVKDGTLVNALLYHCSSLSGVGGRLRPGIVHRLDKDTSGLLVAAKDDATHLGLQEQFHRKTAFRVYRALVWGHLQEKEGVIHTRVGRSPTDRKKFTVTPTGKPAITLYQVECEFDFLSLVQVQLKTGKTHQIRIHFHYLQHPVFGDPVYGGRRKQLQRLVHAHEKRLAVELLKMMPRQALHAYRLGFYHPISGEWMEFTSPVPADMQAVLARLGWKESEHLPRQ